MKASGMAVTPGRVSYLENYHVYGHETGCKMLGSCCRVQLCRFGERRHGRTPDPSHALKIDSRRPPRPTPTPTRSQSHAKATHPRSCCCCCSCSTRPPARPPALTPSSTRTHSHTRSPSCAPLACAPCCLHLHRFSPAARPAPARVLVLRVAQMSSMSLRKSFGKRPRRQVFGRCARLV